MNEITVITRSGHGDYRVALGLIGRTVEITPVDRGEIPFTIKVTSTSTEVPMENRREGIAVFDLVPNEGYVALNGRICYGGNALAELTVTDVYRSIRMVDVDRIDILE